MPQLMRELYMKFIELGGNDKLADNVVLLSEMELQCEAKIAE